MLLKKRHPPIYKITTQQQQILTLKINNSYNNQLNSSNGTFPQLS